MTNTARKYRQSFLTHDWVLKYNSSVAADAALFFLLYVFHALHSTPLAFHYTRGFYSFTANAVIAKRLFLQVSPLQGSIKLIVHGPRVYTLGWCLPRWGKPQPYRLFFLFYVHFFYF